MNVASRLRSRDGATSPAGSPGRLDRVVSCYTDRWGVVVTFTLVGLIILPPRGTPRLASVVALAGLFGLMWLREDWRYWAVLTATTASGVLRYPLLGLDNHHFLLLYWLAAVTFACLAQNPLAVLSRSARLLIGLVFAFATLWKVITPDFADGAVLTYMLSANENAAELLRIVGLQDAAVLEANREAIAGQQAWDTSVQQVPIHVSAAAERMAPVLTFLTFVIEATIALIFLLPLRGRSRWLREIALFIFIFATYPLIPVVGFGWLLLTMGLAGSALQSHRATAVYVAAFICVGALLTRDILLGLLGFA